MQYIHLKNAPQKILNHLDLNDITVQSIFVNRENNIKTINVSNLNVKVLNNDASLLLSAKIEEGKTYINNNKKLAEAVLFPPPSHVDCEPYLKTVSICKI